MDEQPSLPGEVRASLPPLVQAYLTYLEAKIGLLQDQVTKLEAGMAKLQAQLADVQARADQHSGNSSRPPSTDPLGAPPRPKQPPSGRKRGGQPGHPGHARLQLAAVDLTAVVEYRPLQCPSCTLPLGSDLPIEGEPDCVQVWEVPPIAPQIIEHRGYRVRCPYCAVLVPTPDLPAGAFGPRLTAVASVLHGRFRLSMRETTEVLDDLFGIALGAGSVSTLCQDVNVALGEPYEAVRTRVEAETRANVDETGWKQAGERRWLWVAVTALCTLFVVAKNRSAAVLASVLGETFGGVVSSDRYKAYLSIPIERRQVCWAHLKRNLVAFAERGGEIGDWGTEAVGVIEKIFAAWYRYKEGSSDRTRLQEEVAPLREQMQKLWKRGTILPSWIVRALCNDVAKLEPALWTFLTVEGVEPTNNAAERALRPAVLWRKGCFGAASTEGNAFVARILTVAATCHQQQRNLLDYLTDAVIAHRHGQSTPLLLATS
jgi:transposase